MATYVRCITDDEWKFRKEETKRIVAAGEPTPKKNGIYKVVGHFSSDQVYDDGRDYKGYILEEFNWREYLVPSSSDPDKLVPLVIIWNAEKFETAKEVHEPNYYDEDMGLVEAIPMVIQMTYNLKK